MANMRGYFSVEEIQFSVAFIHYNNLSKISFYCSDFHNSFSFSEHMSLRCDFWKVTAMQLLKIRYIYFATGSCQQSTYNGRYSSFARSGGLDNVWCTRSSQKGNTKKMAPSTWFLAPAYSDDACVSSGGHVVESSEVSTHSSEAAESCHRRMFYPLRLL